MYPVFMLKLPCFIGGLYINKFVLNASSWEKTEKKGEYWRFMIRRRITHRNLTRITILIVFPIPMDHTFLSLC